MRDNKMRHPLEFRSRPWRDQKGVTGLETAIVLIAFVVVSSVFAFAALSTGLFTADKSKETIRAGLDETRGTLEVKGSIILVESSSTADNVQKIQFQVANAAGGQAVVVAPGRTIVKYSDGNQSEIIGTADSSSLRFTITPLGNADNDNLVEQGELYQVTIENMDSGLTAPLATGDVFQVEMIPPRGAVLVIERTLPISLETVTDLG